MGPKALLAAHMRGIAAKQAERVSVVDELKARDREVRAHEQAHVAAAGSYARGGPAYTYQRGPDGQNYAVGGEVSIDTSAIEGDPEATIRKAQVVRAAALAPADPSAQDRAVAAAATQMEAQARQDLQEQQQVEESAGMPSRPAPSADSAPTITDADASSRAALGIVQNLAQLVSRSEQSASDHSPNLSSKQRDRERDRSIGLIFDAVA